MQIYPSTYSNKITVNLEKEYKKARVKIRNASRDFFKVSGLVKECFIEGVSKIKPSDDVLGTGLYIDTNYSDSMIYYSVLGRPHTKDMLKDIMTEVYKNIVTTLKRNQYILEKTQTAGARDIFNKKGVKVGVLTRKSKKTSYYYNSTFNLIREKQETVDTTTADDKVIKQMLTLCEKATSVILKVEDKALKLENAIEDEDFYDDDGDKLYRICLPANKYIKQLFTLCRKIKNPELKEAVLNCLDEFTYGADWDEVVQTWAKETGWDAISGIDEWAEATFGEYLETHDIHVFDSVREY